MNEKKSLVIYIAFPKKFNHDFNWGEGPYTRVMPGRANIDIYILQWQKAARERGIFTSLWSDHDGYHRGEKVNSEQARGPNGRYSMLECYYASSNWAVRAAGMPKPCTGLNLGIWVLGFNVGRA